MADRPTLSDLHARLVKFRDQRNWRKFHTPKDLAMSVSIESAELLELFQWKSDEAAAEAAASEDFRAEAADEIADILIYLTLIAGELDIDMVEAAFSKVERNEKRFPASS